MIVDAPDKITSLETEILRLRRLLWLSHGHKHLYGDDGEMQCNDCTREYGFWDWKRTSIDEIECQIYKANLQFVKGVLNLAPVPHLG